MTAKNKLKDYYEQYSKLTVRKDLKRLDEYRFRCLFREIRSIEKVFKGKILTIVDAGAGDGQLSISLAALKHKVIAIDIAESRLAKFAKIANELGIRQVISELNSISLNDEAVDVVVCSEVLEHLEDPQAVLAEFARITKKGGYLLISVPYAQVLRKTICPHCLKDLYIHGHINSFNKSKLKEMIESVGYSFVRSKVIAKPIASRLLRTARISARTARIIDTFHPKVENKGWLIMVGKK
jgi:ubiquinone/menaquinone biosynthesis C-methylase UbiE